MKQFSKDLGNVCLAPKGKWSREQEYERLALVYNACNNLSYVAKINVPSGVEIDNREYWQPMNATGYADNNFINLTAENENGTITAYESIEEAIATIVPVNRRAGATISFYNLNSDRLDRQAEFELWQFNSTDLANWENKDYWNNIYYNWNVFAGWYIDADALNNHVKIPNVGQYAYVGSNLNDAILYQCRTNGTWTNTGIKVRNYISVVVSGNITIGENGNWFSDGEDTGIPATPAVDEQLDNIITKHESLSRTVQGIAATGGASTATNVTYNNDVSGLNAENAQDAIDELSSSKFDKTSIAQELGTALDKIVSQNTVKTELDKKAEQFSKLDYKTNIVYNAVFDKKLFTDGFCKTDGVIGNQQPMDIDLSRDDWQFIILNTKEGDSYIISATGNQSTALAYAFIDKNNILLSGGSWEITDKMIIAPKNSSKLIVNNNKKGQPNPKVLGFNSLDNLYFQVKRNITEITTIKNNISFLDGTNEYIEKLSNTYNVKDGENGGNTVMGDAVKYRLFIPTEMKKGYKYHIQINYSYDLSSLNYTTSGWAIKQAATPQDRTNTIIYESTYPFPNKADVYYVATSDTDYVYVYSVLPNIISEGNFTIIISEEISEEKYIKDLIGYSGSLLYRGNKINLQNFTYNNSVFITKGDSSLSNGKSHQGMDIIDNKIFCLYDTGVCNIFDYKTKFSTPIGSFQLDSFGTDNHANCANFGIETKKGASFPLLYVSVGKVGASIEYHCHVESITKVGEVYSSELVQTIILDATEFTEKSYQSIFGSPCWLVDKERKQICAFSAIKRTTVEVTGDMKTNKYVATIFNLPALSDGETITLTADDIISQHIFDFDTYITQGGTMQDGKIYYSFGYGRTNTKTPSRIRVYDIDTNSIYARIELENIINEELEDLSIYNGKLYVNVNSSKIYEMNF
ncbi:MAG: hypothetical protein SPG97_02000 [Bacilli bacterium]|nr:hypothetical protein [Bacilli bacterium]